MAAAVLAAAAFPPLSAAAPPLARPRAGAPPLGEGGVGGRVKVGVKGGDER